MTTTEIDHNVNILMYNKFALMSGEHYNFMLQNNNELVVNSINLEVDIYNENEQQEVFNCIQLGVKTLEQIIELTKIL